MMKRLRCAIIGCGRIGCEFDDFSKGTTITHAGSYFKNPNTKLVSLCDIDKKKLVKYGKKYKVKKLYNNSFEMFTKEDLDCISICTLANSHFRLVNQAVNAGVKGIFLEKPISDTLKNAKKIIEICIRNNVILAINHQRRYDPFYISIRKFIKSRRMGKIHLVNVYYGGGIANTGTHMFDLLRFFFGEVKSLSGICSKNQSGKTHDPNIDLRLEFRNKINCTIQSLDYRNYGLFEMDIFSSKGRLNINLAANIYEFKYHKKLKVDASGYGKLSPFNLKVNIPKDSAIFQAVKNMVYCFGTRNKPLCTGVDGYKSLELVIASIMSSKQRKIVKLPISNNNYKISSK